MRFYKYLIIAPLLVGLGWAQEQGSLGQIAKQSKTAKKAKIVITDDDVSHSLNPGPAATQSAATTAATPDGKSPSDASPDPKAKGPAAQQSKDPKINELRQKVDKLKAAEEMYSNGLKAGQERLAKATSGFERETAQEIVANQTRNVQATSDKRKQAEAELSALEQGDKQ